MFKKLKAFTMAEAILVMTILGIIATIMISTLKPAEYKEKSMQIMAKKVLSQIDVATTQIIMNDTVDGTFDTVLEQGTSNVINFHNYEDSYASNKLANLYKKYLTAIRKEPEVNLHGDADIVLKDGSVISILYLDVGSSFPTIFPGETNTVSIVPTHGYIRFDINDNEGPNVYGKDRYTLPLGKHGIMYAD